MREKRERGEQTGTTGRVKGEGEKKKERMPLFVNQSAVSERENSKNPQREEKDEGASRSDGGGGGY